MLGVLGLRIFEATGANIEDLGEEHGHRVSGSTARPAKSCSSRCRPPPPAVGRAIERAVSGRVSGPILLNSRGAKMDRHAATRRLRNLARTAGVRIG
jgi:integrase/recombinase XerD